MQLKAHKPFYFFIFCILYNTGFAQNITQSPYSVIGIGEMQFLGNAQLSAMGEVTQGIRSTSLLNNSNPASYSAFDLTQFEAGLSYRQGIISNSLSKSTVENFSFSYFGLGIPISQKKGIGLSFGIQPYSAMGYNLTLNTPYPNNIPASARMSGRGGITRFYAGTGIKLYKGLSAGVNFSYLLGQMSQSQLLLIDPKYNQFNVGIDLSTSVSDVQWQFGTQYEHKFNANKYSLVLGATYTLASKLNSLQDYSYRTVREDGLYTVDTIDKALEQIGTIDMPSTFKIGAAFAKKDKWLLAVDGSFTNWQDFKFYNRSDSLVNSTGLSVGYSYTPDNSDYKNMLNRFEYRVGFKYNSGNLNIRNTDISMYGISAGIGIPLGKSRSRVNITVEYASRGTTANNLLREDYFRVILGVSMIDRWFNRYRYD